LIGSRSTSLPRGVETQAEAGDLALCRTAGELLTADYSCGTAPDLHRLRLRALPSGDAGASACTFSF